MSENWAVQVSVKSPAGSLINLRAGTGDEVEKQLEWLTRNAPQIAAAEAAFGAVANVAGAFPGSQVVEQSGPSWSQQGSQQAAPAAAPAGKSCVHGTMVYREAKPGSGKDWKAYFCPTPQGSPNQCKPEFLR